jgi:hypothetical protein
MNDLLEQATRALRETTSEPQPRSGLTRARLLESAEKRYTPRRVGILRWVVAIVAALAASTALARVAQYWPEIKRVIAPESGVRSNAAPHQKKPAPKPAPAVAPSQPSAAGAPALEAPAVMQPASAPPALATAPALPKKRTAPVHRAKPMPHEQPTPVPAVEPAPAPTAVAAAPPTPTATPAPESAELALFRRAQRLHLARDPRALSAWDDFLRVAGEGALAPEAKYNRALCLIRLGRAADAKRALTPFAGGEYGNYRRAEAKSLIDAIDRASK